MAPYNLITTRAVNPGRSARQDGRRLSSPRLVVRQVFRRKERSAVAPAAVISGPVTCRLAVKATLPRPINS